MTEAWIFWIVGFIVIEGKAIMDARKGKPGGTLSEHIWAWFDIEERESNWTGKRIALVAGLVWLLAHLGFRVI